ncbi:hypothetical protein HHK36_005125 [Tetracentron sinense]|uniref:Uncharacterized protein n=1 Tax=Tetracentron sinense TaxID=13715 RepID=A0A835DM13_TETSI|nr:hypothetical protein HHK36_005125 [Tetracentron sinense]
MGMRLFACGLRHTLVDVKISCLKRLDAVRSLRALEPIRDLIQRLHIDCLWDSIEQSQSEIPGQAVHNFNLNEIYQPAGFMIFITAKGRKDWDDITKKKCRYSVDANCSHIRSNSNRFWCRTWERLQYLSLWIAVGDSRRQPKPSKHAFGLITLARYPQLLKMQFDCGEAIGYALMAPSGQMDLNLWERLYLNGIGYLTLNELDYWSPQDRDVNQRSLSLPATGLLAECGTLRKLFIHGTANEHFMMFLPRIPNLRDVQLREDYYPAPENDTNTEMRVESCSRFEDTLNMHQILD